MYLMSGLPFATFTVVLGQTKIPPSFCSLYSSFISERMRVFIKANKKFREEINILFGTLLVKEDKKLKNYQAKVIIHFF